MIRSYTSALALLAASATPGFAETALGDNFTIDGYAEIGVVKYSGSDSEEFYRGDMDLRYAQEGSVLGFSLGIDGYGVASQKHAGFLPRRGVQHQLRHFRARRAAHGDRLAAL